MVIVEEKTLYAAPIEVVFDAERDISLHSQTQGHRGEKAVDGVTSGLIGLGQEVEWEAVHFGIRQRLRVRITHMDPPTYFRDEMIKGAFKRFSHEHRFRRMEDGRTEKTDIMRIEAPLGPLGRIAEVLFLGAYMRAFLRKKNRDMKRILEAGATARVIRKLTEFPGLRYGRLRDRLEIEAPGPEGFPLSFVEETGVCKVFFGPCPLRFKDADEALEYLAFGLSAKCRLREISRGRPYRWIIEQKDGDGWSTLGEYGLMFFPFWKRKTQKTYMNTVLA
jgi:ligand-binding SRPBCC domain-containing protein